MPLYLVLFSSPLPGWPRVGTTSSRGALGPGALNRINVPGRLFIAPELSVHAPLTHGHAIPRWRGSPTESFGAAMPANVMDNKDDSGCRRTPPRHSMYTAGGFFAAALLGFINFEVCAGGCQHNKKSVDVGVFACQGIGLVIASVVAVSTALCFALSKMHRIPWRNAMSRKSSKKFSCHIVCPECGSRLSTLDHGYSVCYECGWSWSPVTRTR